VTFDDGASNCWSRFAGTAFVASTTAVVLLHVLRPDLDPVRRRLSEYAVGRFGGLMTAAFVLFGCGLCALSRAVRPADATTPTLQALQVLLGIAGVGMILSGIFETQIGSPVTAWREIVHSQASALAFVALVAAAVLTATAARGAMAWGPWRVAADAITVVATLSAAISPITHDGPWAGLVQRVSYLAVLCWLLVVTAATARTRRAAASR
jgi:hypothetical protein